MRSSSQPEAISTARTRWPASIRSAIRSARPAGLELARRFSAAARSAAKPCGEKAAAPANSPSAPSRPTATTSLPSLPAILRPPCAAELRLTGTASARGAAPAETSTRTAMSLPAAPAAVSLLSSSLSTKASPETTTVPPRWPPGSSSSAPAASVCSARTATSCGSRAGASADVARLTDSMPDRRSADVW